MGIISDILDQVDAAVDSVAQDGFISSAAAVGNVITAGAVLLLILLGINVVMQLRPMTFGSAFAFGIKISLVAIFAQSWDNFEHHLRHRDASAGLRRRIHSRPHGIRR